MSDTRRHRGPGPEDSSLFGPKSVPVLRRATADLCWLLTRDYAMPSALVLVGNRYDLTARQRTAVMRCACSDDARVRRQQRQVRSLEGLAIDGYNVLTTVETALAGGVILIGRDGCWRDIASLHGTWRKVAETRPAIELIGQTLLHLGAREAVWYLDRPVSNSGRLRHLIEQIAAANAWNWQVELTFSPDAVLKKSTGTVATADSAILEACAGWFPLAAEVVRSGVPGAWLVELAGE